MADLSDERVDRRGKRGNANPRIEQAVNALLEIHRANKIERITYLIISVISFAMLIGVAARAVWLGDIDLKTYVALFGATGVIGVCLARVLSVWKDCLKFLSAILHQELGQ